MKLVNPDSPVKLLLTNLNQRVCVTKMIMIATVMIIMIMTRMLAIDVSVSNPMLVRP